MNLTRIYYSAFFIVLIISAFSYVDFAITALLLITSGVLLCGLVFRNRECKSYALSKLMLAYLAWLFVVALNSAVPNPSMATLAILAGLPVTYLLASNLPNYSEIWKTLRIVFFVLAQVLASWAIWQVSNNIGYGQAVGPLLDRNAFAALMNLLWFPSAYLFISSAHNSKRTISTLLGFGLFIISIALFATSSRGGIATWALLLPVFLWATYKYTNSRLLVLIVPIIALIGYFCSSQLLHSNIADRTFHLVQDGSVQDESTNVRLQIWQSTIRIALDHPILGTGWGTFGYIYPAYRLQKENISSGFLAHNDYLQFAAEGGLPALLILLSILVALLFLLKRSLKYAASPKGLESIALTLGVLALFIQAGVNFIFYYSFIGIIAGLYLASAAQLTDKFQTIQIWSLEQIRPSVKRLLIGVIITVISLPFVLHIIATIFLTGSQLAIKAVNVVAPDVSAFDVARLIAAVRPAEGLAQSYMLQTYEYYLKSDSSSKDIGIIDKRDLLAEAIERFDSVRKLEANNPRIGVREVKILMEHQSTFGTNNAHAKIRQILNDNLRADPYHADSMIALSRMQVAEGNMVDALNTLQYAEQHILTRRDEQLIVVEALRQQSPKPVAALDEIEEKLHQVHSASEAGVASRDDAAFYDDIEMRLNTIMKQIQQQMN